MNGLHIQQIFIAGALIGFLYNEEHDYSNQTQYKIVTICFFFIGINIRWW